MKKPQDSAQSNKRVKVFGGVGLGLVALMFGYRMMSSGGSSDNTASTSPSPSSSAATPGAGARTPAAPSAPGGAPTVEAVSTKDPFQALITTTTTVPALPSLAAGGLTGPLPTIGAAAPVSPTATTSVPTALPPPPSTPAPPAAPAPTPTTTVPAPPPPPVANPRIFGVVDVYNSTATHKPTAAVTVSGHRYDVVAGQDFAGSYHVDSVSVSTGCGDFVDGTTPFHICKGATALE